MGIEAHNSSLPEAASRLHYQIRSSLGEGGFGQVFAAWDSKLQRDVALKRLKHPSADMLLREARLAAALQHPAFVKIYALEHDHEGHFIVMERVRGQTLKEWLTTERPDALVALGLIRQLAVAMREAHRDNLVHGDLKPSNLMLDPDGTLRILDFGLATSDDPHATAPLNELDPHGTIVYMAPERLFGAAPDRRGDMYAAGVILYQLVCGSRPFPGLTGLPLATALVQSSSKQWDYPPELHPALGTLIRAMTAHDPARRPPDMAHLCHEIDAIAPPTSRAGPDHVTWLRRLRGRVDRLALRRRPIRHIEPAPVALPDTPPPAAAKEHSGTPPQRHRKNLLASNGVSPLRLPRPPDTQPTFRWRTALFTLAFLLPALLGLAMLPGILSPKATAPHYSETAEIRHGIEALRLFDRPGSLDLAARHFSTVLMHEPDSAAAMAGQSLVATLRYKGDKSDETWLQKAEVDSLQAMRLNDQLALSHIARGFLLEQQGKNELALAAHERALTLAPDELFGLFGKVGAQTRLRRFAEAQTTAAYGLERYPHERIFADQLGTIHFEQGRYQAAEQAFRQSLTLQPDCVFAYSNLSAVLIRQNRLYEALQVLQQGLQIRPNAILFGNLGTTLFTRGDYAGAAEAFRHAVSPNKGNPGDYLGWANLADTLQWLPGQSEEARAAWQKARQLLQPKLARAPDDVTLLSRMGLYAARQGDKAAAVPMLERALTLAPESPNVWFRAGLAYELTGNRGQAINALIRARKTGYPASAIDAEPDLAELRRDPAYR